MLYFLKNGQQLEFVQHVSIIFSCKCSLQCEFEFESMLQFELMLRHWIADKGYNNAKNKQSNNAAKAYQAHSFFLAEIMF